MSGLTLYNTLLVEGLLRISDVGFLTGRIGQVQGLVERSQDPSGHLLYEYDCRFKELFEPDRRFEPDLARRWYQQFVSAPDNPVYQRLGAVYKRVIADYRPSVVNPHNLNAAAAYVWGLRGRGMPRPRCVITIHDVEPYQLNFLARHQHLVDRVVAISDSVRSEVIGAGMSAEKTVIIPNGLSLEPFQAEETVRSRAWTRIAEREEITERGYFQVLVPARRVPGKGIEYAVQAFDAFCRLGYDRSRLLISGAGSGDARYVDRLREFAGSMASRRKIHFLGPIRYEEMPALFGASDVSLLPSVNPEGFGYVNIEAMATGRPVVITTAHGGCLDYMEDGVNGLLVPPQDSGAITEALRRVASQPEVADRMAQAGKATAARYDVVAMVRAYTQVLYPFCEAAHA